MHTPKSSAYKYSSRRGSSAAPSSSNTRTTPLNSSFHQKHKSELISSIIHTLSQRGFPNPLTVDDLISPQKSVYLVIMNFLMTKIDPNSTKGQSKDEDIPKFYKDIGYPQTVSKSHVKAPGTPTTWPLLMDAMAWLCELLVYDEREIVPEIKSFSSPGESHYSVVESSHSIVAVEDSFKRHVDKCYADHINGIDNGNVYQLLGEHLERQSSNYRSQIDGCRVIMETDQIKIDECKAFQRQLAELKLGNSKLEANILTSSNAVEQLKLQSHHNTNMILRKEEKMGQRKAKNGNLLKEIQNATLTVETQQVDKNEVEEFHNRIKKKKVEKKEIEESNERIKDKIQITKDTIKDKSDEFLKKCDASNILLDDLKNVYKKMYVSTGMHTMSQKSHPPDIQSLAPYNPLISDSDILWKIIEHADNKELTLNAIDLKTNPSLQKLLGFSMQERCEVFDSFDAADREATAESVKREKQLELERVTCRSNMDKLRDEITARMVKQRTLETHTRKYLEDTTSQLDQFQKDIQHETVLLMNHQNDFTAALQKMTKIVQDLEKVISLKESEYKMVEKQTKHSVAQASIKIISFKNKVNKFFDEAASSCWDNCEKWKQDACLGFKLYGGFEESPHLLIETHK